MVTTCGEMSLITYPRTSNVRLVGTRCTRGPTPRYREQKIHRDFLSDYQAIRNCETIYLNSMMEGFPHWPKYAMIRPFSTRLRVTHCRRGSNFIDPLAVSAS